MPKQALEIGVSGSPSAVTPSDTSNLSTPARYLFVGTGGDLNIVGATNDQSVIHRNVPNGTFFMAFVRRVNSTDTTASNIVAYE